MNTREPNDYQADEHNDRLFSDPIEPIDPMQSYKDMLEAEDAERARNALLDDGRFGEVQHGQPDSISVLKAAVLQAHADFCLVHGLSVPRSSK